LRRRGNPAHDGLVLPNWRIEDITGAFDVFVNAFSFQEMEPDVVAHYIATVAAKNPSYVVSLNSKAGKPVAKKEKTGACWNRSPPT
jgi:hypothetical protein